MPLMTLHRNFVLNSVLGHSIGFEAGKPVYVPPIVVPECLDRGAQFADPTTEIPDRTGEPEPGKPLSPEERNARLESIVRDMLANGSAPEYRGHFTAANMPRVESVAMRLGSPVQAREIADLVDLIREGA